MSAPNAAADVPAESAAGVVGFWLADAADSPVAAQAQKQRWYGGDAALDAEIRERFGPLLARLAADSPTAAQRREAWEASPKGALALVIVLDQFSRHCFRSGPGAFANDALALRVAERAVAAGHHEVLSIPEQVFLHHPFHHSESVSAQRRYVEFTEALLEAAPPEWRDFVESYANYAKEHRDVVARFGRFPHRNAALRRASSAAERDYLEAAERYGQ